MAMLIQTNGGGKAIPEQPVTKERQGEEGMAMADPHGETSTGPATAEQGITEPTVTEPATTELNTVLLRAQRAHTHTSCAQSRAHRELLVSMYSMR